MYAHQIRTAATMAAALSLTLAACGTKPNSSGGNAAGYINASTTALNEAAAFSPGFTKTSPNKAGSIEVTISGETLGENGLPFNPVNMGDPQFVDGWNVSFKHYIVVFGDVRLSPNALQYAQQNILNPVVAERKVTYVVDVHNLATIGTNGFVGADGEEPAGGLFVWNARDDGTPFDTSTLYAFSYTTQEATYPATNVNLTDDELAIYAQMVQNHWDKYIEGTATYVGTCDCPTGITPSCGTPQVTTKSCTSDSDCLVGSCSGGFCSASVQQEFDAIDTTVSPLSFKFGWNDHTDSLNCINPDNGNGDEADLANRGIQPQTSGAVIGQVTIHTDHVFWDELKHEGAPLRMDPLAAWALPSPTSELDVGTLADKPYAPVTFADGIPIPDRGLCQNVPDMGYTATDQPNPSQITLNLDSAPAANIAGIANFMAFSAQSQTHLNANGLCYIDGQNASDPWYVPDVGP